MDISTEQCTAAVIYLAEAFDHQALTMSRIVSLLNSSRSLIGPQQAR